MKNVSKSLFVAIALSACISTFANGTLASFARRALNAANIGLSTGLTFSSYLESIGNKKDEKYPNMIPGNIDKLNLCYASGLLTFGPSFAARNLFSSWMPYFIRKIHAQQVLRLKDSFPALWSLTVNMPLTGSAVAADFLARQSYQVNYEKKPGLAPFPHYAKARDMVTGIFTSKKN